MKSVLKFIVNLFGTESIQFQKGETLNQGI